MLKQTALLKALPWGTNFTVALDDEWNVIENPDKPNHPLLGESPSKLMIADVRFTNALTRLKWLMGEVGTPFILVPKNVTLETFYDFIDTLS